MKFELVWSDEFNYEGKPNPEKWTYDVGGHGGGNNEAQYYTDQLKNIEVYDGALHIKAIKEPFENKSYTSGKITTEDKQSFQYGRFVIKAKIPKGIGTWPAIWLMPISFHKGVNWPLCGEIDIMEHIGRIEDLIHFTIHTEAYNHGKKTQLTHSVKLENITERFAEYELVWTPEYLEYFVDGISYVKYEKGQEGRSIEEDGWPFDQPFYIILNLAVGGHWGGPLDESCLPAEMVVEFVKYYQIVE